MRSKAVFICGDYYQHLEPRADCPNTLHDWPLPSGYNEAADQAKRRLQPRNGWHNVRCPDCQLYGWRPGRIGEYDKQVPHAAPVTTEAQPKEETP